VTDALMSPETPQAAEDDTLMARVAARDAEAFRALIEAHAGKAHRIGWRMLGDVVEAEDVAQEPRRYKSLSRPASPPSFLKR
jgi:DNA-directed RNA polymerase specialized sigma24 family protein